MLAEYLKLGGLAGLAIVFWFLPVSYPLKKHEQGISLAIALISSIALIHTSKQQIWEEEYEEKYQLMEQELARSELVYHTFQTEQLMQQQYTSARPEVLPGSTSTPFPQLPGSTSASTDLLPGSGSRSEEDRALLAQINSLKAQGLTTTAIIKQMWGVSSGRAFQRARQQYKRLTGE